MSFPLYTLIAVRTKCPCHNDNGKDLLSVATAILAEHMAKGLVT